MCEICFIKKLYKSIFCSNKCDSTPKSKPAVTPEVTPEVPLMLKRIQVLYKKLELIRETEVPGIVIGVGYPYDFMSIEIVFYAAQIPTTYGNRVITVGKKRLTYGTPENLKRVIRRHEPSEYSNILFDMNYERNLRLTPYPLLDWTTESIDLAILEFEEAVEPYYKEATKRYNNFNKIFNYCAKDKP